MLKFPGSCTCWLDWPMAAGSLIKLLASANRINAEDNRRIRSRKPRGLIVSLPPQENGYANAFMHYSRASAIESIARARGVHANSFASKAMDILKNDFRTGLLSDLQPSSIVCTQLRRNQANLHHIRSSNIGNNPAETVILRLVSLNHYRLKIVNIIPAWTSNSQR
jgi:hypothetical protein